MADLECPECGTRFPTDKDWAKSAVSTLIAAPAVPAMATSVRCPRCQHVFTESEVRPLQSSLARRTRWAFRAVTVAVFVRAAYRPVAA